jgi:hypothetical protein
MNFPIGMESGDENRSIAWFLGHPGCFAYGPGPADAFQAAGDALKEYNQWILKHNEGQSWINLDDSHPFVDENWDVYCVNESYERVEQGYSVNAWFVDDWKPLTDEEVERGLKLLSWSRADLLATISELNAEVMSRKHPNERWDIHGILRHVANAEWWYLDRLGLAFPRTVLHSDTQERLEKVRSVLVEVLPQLSGKVMVQGIEAEIWSPRKLLRRAVWHERDHTEHIHKLAQI